MKVQLLLFLFLFEGRSKSCSASLQVCDIRIPNEKNNSIIVVDENNNFLYPDPTYTSVTKIKIACPGGSLLVNSISYNQTIESVCVNNTQFSYGNTTFDFNAIRCSSMPTSTHKITNKACENNGRQIKIGFELDARNFAHQILICFDTTNEVALYSAFKITKSINNQKIFSPRPKFDQGFCYPSIPSVNDLYTLREQKKTINRLVGLPKNSTKYVKDFTSYFLSRGHLAANGDFVYIPQKCATFYYMNAAPQWQTFNAGNWQTVEDDVRDLAASKILDLTVYTGTYGIMSLPHAKTRKNVPIYLYAQGTSRKFPVPELFWKVVYDPLSNAGIVLLGLNNPYAQRLDGHRICTDISNTITWLHWNNSNHELGLCYACAVDDFRRRVNFPQFQVSKILK